MLQNVNLITKYSSAPFLQPPILSSSALQIPNFPYLLPAPSRILIHHRDTKSAAEFPKPLSRAPISPQRYTQSQCTLKAVYYSSHWHQCQGFFSYDHLWQSGLPPSDHQTQHFTFLYFYCMGIHFFLLLGEFGWIYWSHQGWEPLI